MHILKIVLAGFLIPTLALASYLGDPVVVKSGGTGLSTVPSAGQFLVGNAGGTAYALILMSGDATMAASGAITIANSAITNAKIANSTIDLTAKVTGVLPNANTTAASANTPSAIVTRDGSGNFTAGTITAAITGTASGNLTATPTNHGVLISGSGNAASVTAVGATNQVLHGNTGADPTYSAIVNADITNATIDLTTKVTNLLPAANVNGGRAINPQTGTTYTFVLGDASNAGGFPLVTGSNASAETFTVPPQSSVVWLAGAQIDVCQIGAGKLTLAQGAGVTINSLSGNKAIGGQYVCVTLVRLASDSWLLIGNLIP